MRLDKFLKVSRLIKRRTVAKEQIDSEKVLLNSKIAKASSEVKIGDKIFFVRSSETFEVTNIYPSATEEKAKEMYKKI